MSENDIIDKPDACADCGHAPAMDVRNGRFAHWGCSFCGDHLYLNQKVLSVREQVDEWNRVTRAIKAAASVARPDAQLLDAEVVG